MAEVGHEEAFSPLAVLRIRQLTFERDRLREVNAELLAACGFAEDYLIRAGHFEGDGTRGGAALAAIAKARGSGEAK